MKSLLLLITLFIVALIVTPFLPTTETREASFNYTITGCAETEEGMTMRDIMPDNVSPALTPINGDIKYYRATSHLCCRKATVNYDQNKSVINIYEDWTGVGCRCICYSEINATISGLPAGTYIITVFETGIQPDSNESMIPRILISQTITLK